MQFLKYYHTERRIKTDVFKKQILTGNGIGSDQEKCRQETVEGWKSEACTGMTSGWASTWTRLQPSPGAVRKEAAYMAHPAVTFWDRQSSRLLQNCFSSGGATPAPWICGCKPSNGITPNRTASGNCAMETVPSQNLASGPRWRWSHRNLGARTSSL